MPLVDMTSIGVNPAKGNTYSVQVSYDGSTLAMAITDTVTNVKFSTSWTVNIPGTVGGNTAYVALTAGMGGQTAFQDVLNRTYTFP